jgi:hypothetical protein
VRSSSCYRTNETRFWFSIAWLSRSGCGEKAPPSCRGSGPQRGNDAAGASRDGVLKCFNPFSQSVISTIIGMKVIASPDMPLTKVLSQPGKLPESRRLLVAFAAAALFSVSLVSLSAAPRSYSQQKALKHHQKEERKQLRQQQAAMKRVMAQHVQTAASRRRFQDDLKMQRELLHKRQKEEIRRLKVNRRSQKTGRDKF